MLNSGLVRPLLEGVLKVIASSDDKGCNDSSVVQAKHILISVATALGVRYSALLKDKDAVLNGIAQRGLSYGNLEHLECIVEKTSCSLATLVVAAPRLHSSLRTSGFVHAVKNRSSASPVSAHVELLGDMPRRITRIRSVTV